jgi:hypothetical protein
LREILNFVVGHGVVIGKLLSCFDIFECFVVPIGTIEADSAVGAARMVHGSSDKCKEHPFIHIDLTCMRAVRAVINLHLASIDDLSFLKVLGCVKACSSLVAIFYLTIVFCHFIISYQKSSRIYRSVCCCPIFLAYNIFF